ncbi:T9SS type B sorting domain-containing protein [Flavobacterium capsici]|uniref:T9SS type B sorting domain-containing protein n=1 Tax=Flavobacterium capsici TaxID=3075618 RepID=A0AA96F373_9FLAO|nr:MULTISPECIES: T9SS type B sorting domain-containing protein [unclassified Flavobacterium]WNM18126.1 T9SS type B sorting domain-containing protein [Flavobacterium sp. PMR2A8]WNM22178.1 T9SS type B sorting domain-containing protein [Flavobacterium sp. PMTSA4]
MRSLFYIFFILFSSNLIAQIGLCDGVKGEIKFYENFGEAQGIGSPLLNDEITYSYTENFPEAGEYTIRSNTLPGTDILPNSWLWHLLANGWSTNPGKMLLINANGDPGVFYKKKITGLCDTTNYEFSFWAASLYNINSNLCSENNGLGVPVNFKIEVWDVNETQILNSVVTGNINNSTTINFQQYGLVFSTLSGQSEVIVKISNNNQQSGCGNDLAIDEIKIQLCGDNPILSSVEYENNSIFCAEDTPINFTLNLENSSLGNYFLWQQSIDEINWTNIDDIPSQFNNNTINFNITNIVSTTHFRVAFASSTSNLSNDDFKCSWYSNIFTIRVLSSTDAPVSFFSEASYCGDNAIPALAIVPVPNLTVNWYDSAVGGNLLQSNSFNYVPDGPGIYYAAYDSTDYPCLGDIRTPITLLWYPGIEIDQHPPPILICGGEGAILDALHPNSIYEWEPSYVGNTQTVTVYEPGLYTVTIRDLSNPCVEAKTRTFIVEGYQNPEILQINNIGNSIIVTMTVDDNYEYSLDGITWQSSNIFENVEAGLINVYVRDLIQCGMDSMEYFFLGYIPAYFTPNGDSYNDVFTIKNMTQLNLTVQIFDRYGKIITVLNSANPTWNGNFNEKKLPSSDYWYKIIRDDIIILVGHVALKR